MLIVMDQKATKEQIDLVVKVIEAQGLTARPIPGGDRVAIGILRNRGALDPSRFLGLPGVRDAIPVTRPHKLVGREFQPADTVIPVGEARIGGDDLTLIAGPCAIEGERQALTIAKKVRQAGAQLFRGGAFKPRTSPYSFMGLGEEGLRILSRVREVTGMAVVTEALDNESFSQVEEHSDVIQIGTRNMQNYSLLRRAGRSKRPILLKRGMAATVDEWLMAAEYILEAGNPWVILCERGIRTFCHHTRHTLDLSAIPVVRRESHLPVIVDPSHAGGRREQVIPLSRAAVAVGAHGLIIEVHHTPEVALCDGPQSLLPEQFESLCKQVRSIFALCRGQGGDAHLPATALAEEGGCS